MINSLNVSGQATQKKTTATGKASCGIAKYKPITYRDGHEGSSASYRLLFSWARR